MTTPWLPTRILRMFSPPSVSKDATNSIKIGILGAARIAPIAVIHPAKALPSIVVHAVAARDRSRAQKFAKSHNIPKVHDSYKSLVEDPEIDAVYIPLPNGLHFEWLLECVKAGKHVLCEKPFVSNAEQAQKVFDFLAEVNAQRQQEGKQRLVVLDAFHWRCHPLAARIREIVSSGMLGTLLSTEIKLLFPSGAIKNTDIRYNLALAGGSLMDAGCYTINASRLLCNDARPTILQAKAILASDQIDQAMTAQLQYPDGGPKSTIECNFSSGFAKFSATIKAVGERGAIEITNFIQPHIFHTLKIMTDPIRGPPPVEGPEAAASPLSKHFKNVVTEKHYGEGGYSTYFHQLRLFARAVQGEIPESDFQKVGLTSPDSSLIQMQVIDDIYRAVGLQPRP
ncbi:hypothetical protein HK102_003605 [Quaeritorhiza haematococci]|nr:hypothetical protein HK102_003605 [Quaeritorhiza haematococci]